MGTIIAVLEDDPDRTVEMTSVLQSRFAQYSHVIIDNAPDYLA